MKEEYVRQSHMFGSFLEDYPEEKQNILNKLFPTKEIAAHSPTVLAALAPDSGSVASDAAAYWSNRFSCNISYISPNSIFCLLEQDGKYCKVLSTNGELGWIIYPEDAEWTKGCIEEVKV